MTIEGSPSFQSHGRRPGQAPAPWTPLRNQRYSIATEEPQTPVANASSDTHSPTYNLLPLSSPRSDDECKLEPKPLLLDDASSESFESDLAAFIGDIEDVPSNDDDEPVDNGIVTVGLSHITLFPSAKLKKEQKRLPNDECFVLLSTCGMCLDDDQMINLAQASDAGFQQDQNDGKKKSYIPPPVSWSQPVLIVQPDSEEQPESGRGGRPLQPEDRRKVHFDEAAKTQMKILLHTRVGRALGIQDGDKVAIQLAGQTKRHLVRASLDDRASFNVVLEADWLDFLSNSTTLSGRGTTTSRCADPEALVRSVELKVSNMAHEWEEDPFWNARFHWTPIDHLREGILYLESSLVVNHPHHDYGLVAGTGFCIYSCSNSSDTDSMSSDGSMSDRESRMRLPRNRTELVSGYRYLGRPFSPHHAEHSALVEGLEWLFRFQFDKVYIVGTPSVVDALPKKRFQRTKEADIFENEPSPDQELDDSDEDEDVGIPKRRRAISTAQAQIEKAQSRGVEIVYHPAHEEENWEAGELADKALEEGRNATQVLWDNIGEAKTINPKYYCFQNSSLAHSAKDAAPVVAMRQPADKAVEQSDDEWSFLKGEDVLDETFKILESWNVADTTSPIPKASSGDGSQDSLQVFGSSKKSNSTIDMGKGEVPSRTLHKKESTATEGEVPFDEKHDRASQDGLQVLGATQKPGLIADMKKVKVSSQILQKKESTATEGEVPFDEKHEGASQDSLQVPGATQKSGRIADVEKVKVPSHTPHKEEYTTKAQTTEGEVPFGEQRDCMLEALLDESRIRNKGEIEEESANSSERGAYSSSKLVGLQCVPACQGSSLLAKEPLADTVAENDSMERPMDSKGEEEGNRSDGNGKAEKLKLLSGSSCDEGSTATPQTTEGEAPFGEKHHCMLSAGVESPISEASIGEERELEEEQTSASGKGTDSSRRLLGSQSVPAEKEQNSELEKGADSSSELAGSQNISAGQGSSFWIREPVRGILLSLGSMGSLMDNEGEEKEGDIGFSDDKAKLLERNAPSDSPIGLSEEKCQTNSPVPGTMCFLMDLGLIEEAQALADDVSRIFEMLGPRHDRYDGDGEEKTCSPSPAQPTNSNPPSHSFPPLRSESLVLIDPPPPKRLVPSQQLEQCLSQSPLPEFVTHHVQFADV